MTTLGDKPAYPTEFFQPSVHGEGLVSRAHTPGLSKRELAAIKLRVPDSGEPWLDDMIREARRHDDAVMAMQGLLADASRADCTPAELAGYAVRNADALLAELEKKR